MKVKVNLQTRDYRTVWLEGKTIKMIDQNVLPFTLRIVEADSCEEEGRNSPCAQSTYRRLNPIGTELRYGDR